MADAGGGAGGGGGAGRLTDAAKADIQGFATSGYGHLAAAAYIFLTMEGREGVRRWLAELLPEVSSASGWRPAPGEPKGRPPTATNVAFTHSGLAALGLSRGALCSFPAAFSEGMAEPARAAYVLGDTGAGAPEGWLFGGPATPPVHACLLLHAESEAALDAFVARHLERLEGTGRAVALVPEGLQRGRRSRDGKEPFGFRDGIAQPQIVGIKGEGAPGALPTGDFVLGYRDHYGQIAAGPLLPAADDPLGALPPSTNPFHRPGEWRDLGRHGTYVVYRRLEQDVAGFWRFLAAEAERMRSAGVRVGGGGGGGGGANAVWLAAKLMGRWPGGASLVLSPGRDDPALATRDDFLYAGPDAEGRRCPFGSHIRRAHPRDLIRPYAPEQSRNMSNAHRLRRQGSVFGPAFDLSFLEALGEGGGGAALPAIPDDGHARGIHFLAVCADIERQFELVQQQWMRNPLFNGLEGSVDPVAGGVGEESRMVVPLERGAWRTAALPEVVRASGGVYLFLPSLGALRGVVGVM